MARPVKNGLDYFPLNCIMGTKIKLIEAKFGIEGFAIIVKLYQKIYGEEGYYCEWNADVRLLFCHDNNIPIDSKLIDDVVDTALARGIFDNEMFKKYHILTSAGIQRRYMEITKRRNVAIKEEFSLIENKKKKEETSKKENLNSAKKGVSVNNNSTSTVVSDSSVNNNSTSTVVSDNNNRQIKEKKIKENKSKENKRKVNKSNIVNLQANRHAIDYADIVRYWNTCCNMLPAVQKLTDARKRAIKSRVEEYSVNEIKRAFNAVARSDFLSGRSNKWQANFDWCLKPANFQKILEGNYENRVNKKSSNPYLDMLLEMEKNGE